MFLVCPTGELVTIDINKEDEVTVDIMGPSEDTEDPTDALAGSDKKLSLCNGDVFIVKNICPDDAALILRITFTVQDVSAVKMIFLNSSSHVIAEQMVSLDYFKSSVIWSNEIYHPVNEMCVKEYAGCQVKCYS